MLTFGLRRPMVIRPAPPGRKLGYVGKIQGEGTSNAWKLQTLRRGPSPVRDANAPFQTSPTRWEVVRRLGYFHSAKPMAQPVPASVR